MAKRNEGFIQIPNWYWQCGLTLVQVNTLAEIASWQRDEKAGKIFFQSMEGLACKYNISYSQMRRVFKSLLDLRVIKRHGKMKRMWKYTVDANRLNQLKLENNCKLLEKDSVHQEHKDARYCSPEAQILSTESNYNTNKTSLYKTSFKGNESLLERSSPTPEEIASLAADINLDK